MKTMPENLPAIVEAVKQKRSAGLSWETLVPRQNRASYQSPYCWVFGDESMDAPCSADDAYAACVVTLLEKFIASGAAIQIDGVGVWCMGKSYYGDLLPALYAAFVARKDLFGETK